MARIVTSSVQVDLPEFQSDALSKTYNRIADNIGANADEIVPRESTTSVYSEDGLALLAEVVHHFTTSGIHLTEN